MNNAYGILRSTYSIGFLILTSLCLTGCWSARELNQSALVSGVGFDKENSKYKMTIQILQPLKLTPKTMGQSQSATYVTSETGQTVFETIRTFPHKTTRKLFWSHCQIFVIGHELADDSISQTLDWFYRNQELRPLSFIILSDGEASDVIKAKTPLHSISAYDIADTIQTLTDTSDAPVVNLMDFMQRAASPVESAYIPEINAAAKVIGTGIILRGRLVGFLNLNESKGLVSLIGQTKSGQITVPAFTKRGEHMTVEIIHASVKKQVHFIQGLPKVYFHLNYVVDLADDPFLFNHNELSFHKIELRIGEQIKLDAVQCIRKAKLYHADVIGTGEAIEYNAPQQWQKLVKNWPSIFPYIPIRVDVNVHLRHEGIIQGSK